MGTDRITLIDKDIELQKKVASINWREFLTYGSVKIQVRDGAAVLVTIERTVKMD